jgi:hypothetical protein
LLLLVTVVAVAEQLLRHADGGGYGNADRGAGDDLLAGGHPFLFVLLLVAFHLEPPFVGFVVSSRRAPR